MSVHHVLRLSVLVAVAVSLGIIAACSGCESELSVPTSDRCPDRECEVCEDHVDCGESTFCGEVDGESVCVLQECQPGTEVCEDGGVARCDHIGSGFQDPVECPSGECEDGQCLCDDDDECGQGHSCIEGSCSCPTEVRCGTEGVCCGAEEVCEQTEVCEDGDCEYVEACQPACTGEYCGVDGEICCEGETPVCGPFGECVADCGADRELCGEDFDECCPEGDVCIFGECQTPGDPCDDVTECGFDEYCDEALGKCMPDEFPEDLECTREGEFEEMEVTEKWSWTEDNSTITPLVGDVTGDDETNVVITSMDDESVIILDNQGGLERRIEHDPSNDQYGAHWRSKPALADVTGDGRMEIVYPVARPSVGCCSVDTHIAATNGDGETVWIAHDEDGDPVEFNFNTGAISAANLNGDSSTAEIMAGAALIDSEGRVVSNEGGDANEYGSSGGYTGGVTIAVDLLGNGEHELVTGRHAWTVDWEPAGGDEWPDVDVDLLWENDDGGDGYPAVADIDGDGDPEVVVSSGKEIRVLEGETGELWCGVDPSGDDCEEDDSLRTQSRTTPEGPGGRGAPPTVADYSGNGRPEVGIAGDDYYTVFGFYRPSFGDDDEPEEIDEDLLDEYDVDHPEVGEIFVRWYSPTQDSSRATGSSVFDFQGDGSASVVYNDECYLRVYNGYDGEIDLRLQNSTGTRIEYPIVVDVDENGRSEIVVTANDQGRGCDAWDPDDDYERRSGVYVYEDPNELWVHTRSIWNQHAYSIDNINDDGSVPDLVGDWWEDHNTFRANRQGQVPLHAPDIVVSNLQVQDWDCPPDITVEATIENEGQAVVPEGVPVTLNDADGGEAMETIELDEAISPGGVTTVEFTHDLQGGPFNEPISYRVVANDDGTDDDPPAPDCNPDKASSEVVEGFCEFSG